MEYNSDYNTFESIKIGLASPEIIRSWSKGEVKKPETINYRTLKPERDGLFCEKIFGPTKDWECFCGKYKRHRYKGKVCEKCGVEVTRSKVRRDRMGHIELAVPVSHIWYFKGIPSRMGLLLDIAPRVLEKVLYFASYVVIDAGDTPLTKGQVLSEKEFRDAYEKYENDFRAGMGAEAVKELLASIDTEELSENLKRELETATGQKRSRIIKRLEASEAFRLSGNRPEWMILDVIPVIPPEIRPMVQLDGGRFATSDLNDLYRRVINRNNRLKKLLDLSAPDIIVRNEKRMLQEAVDALIDNGRRGRPVTGPNNRALKSLSDMLKGKQGRFRQNLLGKRVDYSGRSVIVVGPDLKLYQCGLPKEMALELFKPFVMRRLEENGLAQNVNGAKKLVARATTEVWDVLEEVIKEHPVLLNRAPTLHRLGIQAFEPVLVEGRAIKLHPLVCTAYNADFDGDQMAVHVPLSAEAQTEARFLMLSANNLLKPQDGKPVTVPSQDMILGAYYLTLVRPELNDARGGHPRAYSSVNEAMLAYASKEVELHAPIKVRMEKEIDGVLKTKLVECTIGQIIFNEPIPQDIGFVDRSNPDNEFNFEVTFAATKGKLGEIVDRCIRKHGFARSADVLDKIKNLGFKYSTQGAITVSVDDMKVPEEKVELLSKAEENVEVITKKYKRGLLSEQERYESVIKTWEKTTEDVTDALSKNFDKNNPIFMMADSGARGSIKQIRQLAGMRGLMANTSGKTIEVPIRSNFREGLSILEYFISSRGARKGLADTALRTADSGYLTRRLVDVAQDVIIRETDCGTTDGVWVSDIKEGKAIIEAVQDRIVGRYLTEDFNDENGNVLIPKTKLMNRADADLIVSTGALGINVRSVLTCKAPRGVCAKCYGENLASGVEVSIGEAVGIIAAQSIGEPGTQLTMRTFHTGGIATKEDITQGLPRVEELFEARKPKGSAVISEIDGEVSLEESDKIKKIIVTNNEDGDRREYQIPKESDIRIEDGVTLKTVKAGQQLIDGNINPSDLMRVSGVEAAQNYLIREVQKVYHLQGVAISDKHIEVIVRQMLRKVKIEEAGSTGLLPNSVIDRVEFDRSNAEIQSRIDLGEEGIVIADSTPVLHGITKASLATDSFLSAASFQETTKVLTEAAIKGKSDPLLGLKENVIIGKLIPAGTGMTKYQETDVRKISIIE